MERRRRICFVSGTRADFGKIKALLARIEAAGRYDYGIFATGMHMLARYGSTVDEIRKAGFRNIYPFINQDSAISSQMDLTLANTIQGFGHYVREFPPDLIVVHGDRVETLAGAMVGVLNNILVAHIEGGEVSGTVDELIRHAVTKLSHLHFVANDEAARRLAQMGERPESVFVIGSPDIDIMLSDALPTLDDVRRRYAIPFEGYGILLYHPVTTEVAELRAHVLEVVEGVLAGGLPFVVFYPNNDAGSEVILDAYERLRGDPRFRLLPSMRFEYFLSLLRSAEAIVGNSSAGVREAPVYGVPALNVGTRQANRARHALIRNVPEDRAAIAAALDDLPTSHPSTDFGRGDSARLFLEILDRDATWTTPRQKQFRDVLEEVHA